MEELSSDWRVFIYMSARGINLYHVEASAAASVQRLLVSFWRYLANENYDLSSEGFYDTSTLVFSASCWPSRLRLYAYQTIERTGLVHPFTLFVMHVVITLSAFVDILVKMIMYYKFKMQQDILPAVLSWNYVSNKNHLFEIYKMIKLNFIIHNFTMSL